MRRVVVTGMGIVSSIGNNTQEVVASLREAKSGIGHAEDYKRLGFRCQVHGRPKVDLDASIDRRARRFMGDGAAYNFLAMEQALRDSGLEEKDIVNERTGLIMGSGGPSTRAIVAAADTARDPAKGPKRVGPFVVPKAMSSTCSAVLSTWFKIKGVNYSISSACSTSAHCIGNAAELIQWGKQDIVFAGGGEELDWTLSVLFDAMGAMSSHFNDTPAKALARLRQEICDGFVIAGGGGVRWFWRSSNTQKRAARKYWRNSSAMAPRPRWPRHGRTFRRRRGPLHAPGDGDGERPYRLCQRAWHLHAQVGRRDRNQGDAGSWFRFEHPADQFDQVADRSFAGCDGGPGSNLLDPADAGRVHRRKREHRGNRSGRWRCNASRSCVRGSMAQSSNACCPTVSGLGVRTRRSSSERYAA